MTYSTLRLRHSDYNTAECFRSVFQNWTRSSIHRPYLETKARYPQVEGRSSAEWYLDRPEVSPWYCLCPTDT